MCFGCSVKVLLKRHLIKFYLFLNGAKNRFETTLFSPPPSLEDAALIKKEISELLSIIDELNLGLDIFKLG